MLYVNLYCGRLSVGGTPLRKRHHRRHSRHSLPSPGRPEDEPSFRRKIYSRGRSNPDSDADRRRMARGRRDLRGARPLSQHGGRKRPAFVPDRPRRCARCRRQGQGESRRHARLRARRAAAARCDLIGRTRRPDCRNHVPGNRQGDQGRQGRDHPFPGHARIVGRRGRAHRGRAYSARRQRHGRRKNLLHAALSGRRRGGDNPLQCAGEPRLPQDRARRSRPETRWC